MGQPDSYGNQDTCVAEFVILWNDLTWTAEMHDIPIEMSEDDTAANQWAKENLMPYVVTYAQGKDGERAMHAEAIVVVGWP